MSIIVRALPSLQVDMVTKVFASAVYGVNAKIISIEVTIVQGLHFCMVGLPDNAIKESQYRIESVLKHIGAYMPRQRVIVNLAPADIRKEGASYDMPIALGILHASGQYTLPELDKYLIMGELALDGNLRPIKGALPIALEARQQGFKGFVLPCPNAPEAALVEGIEVIPVSNIKEALDFFTGNKSIVPLRPSTHSSLCTQKEGYPVDFSDVQGQQSIKRALEVAAAGSHNVIMVGPPGAGKTMLAKRIPSILPPMSLEEALETTKIYSVSGKLGQHVALIGERPFRAPHHTISDAALVGGGSVPQPGEMSLAHNGVLFLDELPEFKRTVLEVMRQPLEEKRVTIARAKLTIDFPTNFMLVASMNPCPCGYYNHPTKQCVCGPINVRRYLNKISGPLLDRIDLHIEVTPVPFENMTATTPAEPSEVIRKRVARARAIQAARFKKYPYIYSNAMIPAPLIKKICPLSAEGKNLLKSVIERLHLSARAYDRILKVARTIADLSDSPQITIAHLSEAIRYRSLDRSDWAG